MTASGGRKSMNQPLLGNSIFPTFILALIPASLQQTKGAGHTKGHVLQTGALDSKGVCIAVVTNQQWHLLAAQQCAET